jgi:hypothetical protein
MAADCPPLEEAILFRLFGVVVKKRPVITSCILSLSIATFLISLAIAAITRLFPHSEKIFG